VYASRSASLLPVMGQNHEGAYTHSSDKFFSCLENARLPIRYLANMFSAGNTEIVNDVMKKLMAVRYYKRWEGVRDLSEDEVRKIVRDAKTTPEEIQEIYEMTAIPTVYQRYVLPPLQREEAVESSCNPEECKGCTGLGFEQKLDRGL
jgi:nitrate reductase beta subunit